MSQSFEWFDELVAAADRTEDGRLFLAAGLSSIIPAAAAPRGDALRSTGTSFW